jgi:putative endonuclease
MTYQKHIGDRGEQIAVRFLQEKGYRYLEKNYTSRYGELDLVMMDFDVVVFVEVKTRTSQTFGFPEEAVTPVKLERIVNAGLEWLQSHPDLPDDWRVDVIAVQLDRQGALTEINHYQNIDV